jgi:hypothetical protein
VDWLLPPLLLGAVVLGGLIVQGGPEGLLPWVGGLVLVGALSWIAASALWPGKPDRTCPACGCETLERLEEDSTEGVRCSACGHTDAAESSFLIAEDDGIPLEPIVLAERGAVDRTPDAD